MDGRILTALREKVPVVTASRRLARTFLHQYSEIQTGRGAASWESPTVLPWASWLGTLWEEFQFTTSNPPVRLDAWQEWVLWDTIIRHSPQASELLQVGAAVTAIQKSWALSVEWRLDLARIDTEGNDDARTFTHWARQFVGTCESRGWIDNARIPDLLRAALSELRLPSRIVFAGFDEFTPQHTDFIDACRSTGCDVEKVGVEPMSQAMKVFRAPFSDRDQELAAAARWVRGMLETNPRATIGVIVPDLAARRNQVERVFRSSLEPVSQLSGAGGVSQLVNFSAGRPLASYPLVRSALGILSVSRDVNPWDEISALVRDRYIAGAETERTPRGLLDVRLRSSGLMHLTVGDVRRHASSNSSPCPILECGLRGFVGAQDAASTSRTAAQWAAAFTAMLEALGWPGDQPLNSVEYQTVEAWKNALSKFAGTDFVGGEVDSAEALSLLRRIVSTTDFQPESPITPVQVLGAMEATGLKFDHLWVTGLDDESWPGPPSPDPFIPIALQRKCGVPRCSPERELAFAVLVTRRLLASSPDIMLSYPSHDGDRELSPSPLILPVPNATPADLPMSEGVSCADAIRESREVEQIVDELGPSLGDDAWQRGGAKVFQYQAACPFRAFVELRLGAEDLEAPSPGLDARQRGTLIHAALEEFWNEIRTHGELCSRTDIAEVVRRAVASAVVRLERRLGVPLPERFAALECRRLEDIITEWLEIEKQRQPFEVVKPEGEREAEVGGIHFKVKIDRIDRVDDGRDVIIDYKTGLQSVANWESERPDEPQLPLYSVVYNERPLAAVLFGQLKTGDLKFKGVVDGALMIPGADSDDLAAHIAKWRTVMERLAAEFRAGHAEAGPKEPAKTCRYCSLAGFCRVAECDSYWNLEAD